MQSKAIHINIQSGASRGDDKWAAMRTPIEFSNVLQAYSTAHTWERLFVIVVKIRQAGVVRACEPKQKPLTTTSRRVRKKLTNNNRRYWFQLLRLSSKSLRACSWAYTNTCHINCQLNLEKMLIVSVRNYVRTWTEINEKGFKLGDAGRSLTLLYPNLPTNEATHARMY